MDNKHPLFKQLSGSDDLAKHERVFVYAYQSMINDRIATPYDFERQGGWIRSVYEPNFYYIYVGNATNVKERYYLDVTTGQITKGKR